MWRYVRSVMADLEVVGNDDVVFRLDCRLRRNFGVKRLLNVTIVLQIRSIP
jgi:hypothetical protein